MNVSKTSGVCSLTPLRTFKRGCMQLVQTWWNYTSAYKLSTVNTKMYWHRYVWPRISCITNLLPSLTLINDHITDLQRKYRQQTFTQTRVKYIPIISPECLQQIHNRSDYLPKLGHSAPVTLRYLIQKNLQYADWVTKQVIKYVRLCV